MRKLAFLLLMIILAVMLSGCFSPTGETAPTLTSPPVFTAAPTIDAFVPTSIIPTANLNSGFGTTGNTTDPNAAANTGVNNGAVNGSASNNYAPTAVITLNPPASGVIVNTPLPTIQVVLPALGGDTANTNTTTDTTTGTTGNTTGATTCTTTAPPGWVAYTVRTGDTVGSLSVAADVAVQDIISANCLSDADVIQVGQVIYLPAAIANAPVANAAVPASATPAAVAANNAIANGSTSNTTNINGSLSGVSIQNLWVEPAIVEGGQYYVTNGSKVTVRIGGVTNATSVAIMLAPVGNTATPMTLGIDTNLTDGVSVPWQVTTAGLRANIWAVVTDTTGQTVQSIPIVIVSR